MNNNRSASNWKIDLILFTGFITLFFMNITGVGLHQWLGVACGALATYHLLEHRVWVLAVSKRFFGRTSKKARKYYLLDTVLLLGFTTILFSGLVISTWLNRALDNMPVWIDLHITASILTLLVVVFKIAIHRRWLVTATRHKSAPLAMPANRSIARPVPALATANVNIERRNFLKLMGVVGAAAALSILNLADPDDDAVATSTYTTFSSTITPQNTTSSTATPQSSSQSTYCATRCRKGNSCSFPGECHDYRDTNNNGLCDQGGCV